ncbi:MAG: tRNA (N6-threonylcarbamoyladenosine(37)-N6)-methyltransferase TrmO [Polyangiaceae bacterium]|jgi:tRNA-Thr(GGU) m(6)t(6)A37 methyltransferase TsaA
MSTESRDAGIAVRAIGVVRCPVAEPRDDDWGEVVSELHLDPELAPGLVGVEQFSHALVVFWMHRSTFAIGQDLTRRPRGRPDMPELGIFAQRAKHRPNPIGITAVRVVGRSGPVLAVKGLDAIDGTPVLDVKPYVPPFDTRADATVPEWMTRLMDGYFG